MSQGCEKMKRSIMIISVVCLLFIAGCSKKEEKEYVPETGKEVNKEGEITNIAPLTGVATNEEVDSRAIAVMVNNHTLARPQTGLSKADIVYELLAEGEVTRFLAVYQSEWPEQIGPVRSARDYYIDLAKGFDSIFIAHGYSPEAEQMLKSGEIDNINGIKYDGSLFKRSSDRKAPHNSYITVENIRKGAEDSEFALTGAPDGLTFLTEEEIKELNGAAVDQVSIKYGVPSYNVEFVYDQEKSKYTRFSAGQESIDYETKEPLMVENVFIIETAHKVLDNIGRRDVDLQSGGKGYLLYKGQMKEVEWQNKDGRIIPVVNGEEVGFVPGKTWVNIIPNQPGLKNNVTLDASIE